MLHIPNKLRTLLIPVFLFLVILRFVNLNLIPVSIDETEHLYYADRVSQNLNDLFISFSGSTPYPIMIWVLAMVNSLTSGFLNLLLSGRALLATCDLFSAIFIFLIGRKLFDKSTGILATLVYLLLPLNFLHSRLVLLESMANMFALVTIYFAILVITEKSKSSKLIKYYLLTSLFFFLTFFTKPTAIVGVIPTILLPIFINLDKSSIINLRYILATFKRLVLAYILGFLLSTLVFIQFVSKFTVHVNNTFGASTSLFSSFNLNLHKSILWSNSYLTSLIIVLVIVIIFTAFILKKWKVIWFSFWVLTIIAVNSFFSKHYYPRHIYPLAVPVSMIVGWGFCELYKFKKLLAIPLVLIIFLFLLKIDFIIITKPQDILVGEDIQQYYEDWSAGVGLDRIALTLQDASKDKKIIVFTESNNLTYWGLINLFSVGNSAIIPSDDLIPNRDKFYTDLQKTNFTQDVYIILNRNPTPPSWWKVKLVASFPKGPNRSINFYEYLK